MKDRMEQHGGPHETTWMAAWNNMKDSIEQHGVLHGTT